MNPVLFTFDIFGTVLDWYRGLSEALTTVGRSLDRRSFDSVIDSQGRDEQAGYRPYREITARSLIAELNVDAAIAQRIVSELGNWPLFGDSREGLRRLMAIAPCAAMTNSDRVHGLAVQDNLGFRLTHWICAEDVRCYKPSPEFWRAVSRRLDVPFSRAWWHVSAYADYDLEVARNLGLTTVYIPRTHARPGKSDVTAPDLIALAETAGAAR